VLFLARFGIIGMILLFFVGYVVGSQVAVSQVKMLRGIMCLMRMDKPIGIGLLLWPTYWAIFMASSGVPSMRILVIFTVGIVIMRAAGCVINDLADHDIDGHVARTVGRPLVQGQVTRRQAWYVFVVLMVMAFGLACLLNHLAFLLAFVGAGLAMVYPLMKRFFYCPQWVLGLAFSWGIPMAYAAQVGAVPLEAWWLFAISVIWALIYDTEYAMVDREDDLRLGLYSSAILFGRADRIVLAGLQGLMMFLWAGLAWFSHFGGIFWLAWFLALLIFVWQLQRVWSRGREGCFQAFLSNHWLGMVLFVGVWSAVPHG
jgi:4-hydroxybenzoate polyprenyltransferase